MFLNVMRYGRYGWRLLRRPTVVKLSGVRLELGPHTTPAIRTAIYSERFERREARYVIRRLEPSDTVMEIGAGMGFISTLCALRLGPARVFAYEANPAMIKVIEHTYELNGVRPTLTNAALAGNAGTVEFFVEDEFVSSSIIRLSERAQSVHIAQLDVNMEVARIRPTMMVIDIEGAEHELVPIVHWDGINKVIIDLHPQIIGEEKTHEVLSTLERRGFVVDRRLSSTTKKYLHRCQVKQ